MEQKAKTRPLRVSAFLHRMLGSDSVEYSGRAVEDLNQGSGTND